MAKQVPHPNSPEKRITTWHLTEQAAAEAAAQVAQQATAAQPSAQVVEIEGAAFQSSSALRDLLTNGLSDAELTTLLYDNFQPVYRQVGAVARHERIQALLEYVEPRNQSDQLLAAIRRINPALFDAPQAEPLAA
jgi:hypothetical protein